MILGTVSRCQQQGMRSVIKVVSQMPCKKCTLQHDGKLFSSHIQRSTHWPNHWPVVSTIHHNLSIISVFAETWRQISIRHELREGWQLCRAPVAHCHWIARQIPNSSPYLERQSRVSQKLLAASQCPQIIPALVCPGPWSLLAHLGPEDAALESARLHASQPPKLAYKSKHGGPWPQGQAPSIPGCGQAASTPGGEAAQIQTVVVGGLDSGLDLEVVRQAAQVQVVVWQAASPDGGVAGGLDPEVVVWHKGEIEATFLQGIHQAKSNWPSCCCPIVMGKSQVLL